MALGTDHGDRPILNATVQCKGGWRKIYLDDKLALHKFLLWLIIQIPLKLVQKTCLEWTMDKNYKYSFIHNKSDIHQFKVDKIHQICECFT